MNEQKHTMTGAWALNALDADEREQIRRYLEEDPEAAAEARAFEETAGRLAAGLPPLAPRPELKAAVMARIDTTRQLSPLVEEDPSSADGHESAAEAAGAAEATGATGATGATDDAPSAEGPPPAQIIPLDRYRASVRRGRWAAVAAALLLVTTVVGAGLWNSERLAEQEARASLEAVSAAQEQAQEELAMLSSIMSSEDAEHLVLPAEGGGALQLMYSRDREAMVVQAAGLPALPADETYQLWMIDESGPASAGLLGDPATPVMREGSLPEGVTLGLTIEPAGGSEQPTMAPIASGVLS